VESYEGRPRICSLGLDKVELRDSGIRGFVTFIEPGQIVWRPPCARSISPEKLFVDYSGHTIEIVDGPTGEVQTAQIFVAVMGASSYIYAEATLTQKLPDWIALHIRA
jgi:transposase